VARVRADQAALADPGRWPGLAADQVVRQVAAIFFRHAAFLRPVILVSAAHPEIRRRGSYYGRELRELAAALARLCQDQRDVLLLVASGLGYEETALALAVPAGTVSSRLVRARRKVREALGGQDPTRPGEDAP